MKRNPTESVAPKKNPSGTVLSEPISDQRGEIRERLAVITISKDDLPGLRKTLESARLQTNQNFRHVVVDSSENLMQVRDLVSQYEVEYHWTPPQGVYAGMEFGLEKLDDSDYCWFLNSGDTFANEETVGLVIQSFLQGVGEKKTWAVGKVLLIGATHSSVYGAVTSSDNVLATIRKGRRWFPHSSTIVSVAALRSVNPFLEGLGIAQDYLISLKILSRFGPPVLLDDVLSHFQLGGVSTRKTVRAGLEAVKARILVFGLPQVPREIWNVVRVVGGRPLKKVFRAPHSHRP